ncbi:filamentous hemagglutinin N-terminal domain-containing protein [Herbaspirillum sp. YR522]|uniref:two-partner secretion domain-containing protein n=1 Tax=Herbaspirillum sp. YR522 TaxID=1144342 RepID=UPI00026F53A8|nr:filamentous hemagglutinin N-terminal domain-containing protein [Herbaspirillum sp. YR522]EJN05001.1 filamentous hemagglutinin family N-terminal domain containing protein [Herbaspirillum sp. YR522]
MPRLLRPAGRAAGQPALLALLLVAAGAGAAPVGGVVSAGNGNIASNGSVTTINQGSDKLAINWNGFNIGSGETVNFNQPSRDAIALNRVLGTGASEILGQLNANGRVFLINPNGILFGAGASVNVGGLVASTLDLSDQDFMNGSLRFGGTAGNVTNRGRITANDGGFIALLGGQVSNEGTLTARLGNVTLAAGSAMTLDFNGDGLLQVRIDQGTAQALAQNRQMIVADGGTVLLSAQAADALAQAVVNNTGVIQARSVGQRHGQIVLLGDMHNGQVNVGGTLDASAATGDGDGGFIETSAARVKVADDVQVNTRAADGATGTWLIDPVDFTVAASGGDISGAALSTSLAGSNVVLQSSSGASAGRGDLLVADRVGWSADTTLTLTAANDVKVQADITATGNHAGLVINANTANGGSAASGSGRFTVSDAAITLSGSNPSLAIGGNSYTVINDLAALQAVNASLDNVTTRYFALGSNIDASATASWNGGLGFVPLGAWGAEFRGIFDGLGHTVSGLTIQRPSTNAVGFIGYTSGGSMVRNLNLAEVDISGNENVGGAVGSSYGELYNVRVTGTVAGGNNVGGVIGQNYTRSEHIINDATVSGVTNVGGVAGASSGQIVDSVGSGTVNGTAYVGGLVGSSSGMVSNSYASGSVSGNQYVGGLAGYNVSGSLISNSYASGAVHAAIDYQGALVGYNGALSRISASFWLDANGVGYGGNDGVIDGLSRGLSTGQASLASTFAAAGWDIGNSTGTSIWRIYDGNTLPLLRSFLRPTTVTATAAVRDYDGTTGGVLGYTTSNGALLSGALAYTTAARDVGTYTAAAGTLSLGGLYSGQQGYDIAIATTGAGVRIVPATLTVTANDASATADVAWSGGNGVTYSGLVGGDSAASLTGSLVYGGNAQGASQAGQYRISISGLGSSNYVLRYAEGTLTLRAPAPVPVQVTAAAAAATPAARGESYNAPVALLPQGGDLAHGGELLLRIVGGGIRLPQGLAETF